MVCFKTFIQRIDKKKYSLNQSTGQSQIIQSHKKHLEIFTLLLAKLPAVTNQNVSTKLRLEMGWARETVSHSNGTNAHNVYLGVLRKVSS